MITIAARLLEVAMRGDDEARLSALSAGARAALERLLVEIETQLADGHTQVEESAAFSEGFDAAERIAAGGGAGDAPRAEGAIRLLARGAEELGAAAYFLRGEAGRRRISMARSADDERRLAAALLERARRDGAIPPTAAPSAGASDPEALQREAIARARAGSLLLITGGPGSGKTRTIARIAAARSAERDARASANSTGAWVHLLAPTGRAAARLREQIHAEHGGNSTIVVSTIHAALGWRPAPGTPFARTAKDPLRSGTVIVDECSMVDLALMRRLVDAVPSEASLVLVGDADQLASIEAGSVFADLCASPALAASTVRLAHNFRTAGDPHAAWLASAVEAIRSGDADLALERLRAEGALVEPGRAPGDATRLATDLALPEYQSMIDASLGDPRAAFESMRRFRVLAATRRGDGGVEPISRRIEEKLDGGVRRDGRQLIVLRNEPEIDLANGDMGVEVGDGVVVGVNADGSARSVRRASLPDHEPAWAISIHKAQGSEFDRIVVTLPRDDASPILSRQLLYTALTRSRGEVRVVATEASVRAAIDRTISRRGGLAEALERR